MGLPVDDQQREALRAWAVGKGVGHHRRTCPSCSEGRDKAKVEVLSVDNYGDRVVWHCWHCDDGGAVNCAAPTAKPVWQKPPTEFARERKNAVKVIQSALDAVCKLYLKGRGLSESTAELFGVTTGVAYFPDIKKETSALAFPYDPEKKGHGHKVRSVEAKSHVCDKPLASLFGLDLVDIVESTDIIICEGEFDALAMFEAGVLNATSVPNGAQSFGKTEGDNERATLAFLWSAKEKIDGAKRIIIATDMDEPGNKLAEELARRIGKHRCWRVTFGDDCKDANDQLLKHGVESLTKCVEQAEPWPVEGLYEASRFVPDVLKLYEEGVGERILTGMASVDTIYSTAPGMLTIITGIPGSGKSTFVDQLMVNQARTYGHTFAICSFENTIPVHIAKLSEMLTQKHFFETHDVPGQRMSRDELEAVQPFIASHFKFLNQDDGKKATLESIVERIKTAVFRWGINAAVIDPYNYIARPKAIDSETQWIDEMLTTLRLLAQAHGIHIWFVAHPTKLPMDANGNYQAPRGYSISGSAAWYSKADFGLTVHRQPDHPGAVEIICWKCRFDWLGKEGSAHILYDNTSNVYLADIISDLAPMTYGEATRDSGDEAGHPYH
jgi:twinkle protein